MEQPHQRILGGLSLGAIQSAMSEVIVMALQLKRAELARRRENDAQAIAALDVVLALYDEPTPRVFRTGVTRIIVDAMRDAPKPLTIREIAAKLAEAKGSPDDPQRFVSRTERVLYRLRLRRLVDTVPIGRGRTMGWQITQLGDIASSPSTSG